MLLLLSVSYLKGTHQRIRELANIAQGDRICPASTAKQKDSHSIVVVVILPVSDSIPDGARDGARVSGPVSIYTIT